MVRTPFHEAVSTSLTTCLVVALLAASSTASATTLPEYLRITPTDATGQILTSPTSSTFVMIDMQVFYTGSGASKLEIYVYHSDALSPTRVIGSTVIDGSSFSGPGVPAAFGYRLPVYIPATSIAGVLRVDYHYFDSEKGQYVHGVWRYVGTHP